MIDMGAVKQPWKIRLGPAELAACQTISRQLGKARLNVSTALSWAVRQQAERELGRIGVPLDMTQVVQKVLGGLPGRRGRGTGYDRARSVTLAAEDHWAAGVVRRARGFAADAEAMRFALRVQGVLDGRADCSWLLLLPPAGGECRRVGGV